MTNLEHRALLGDKQAQEKCTRQGIVLPCPLCKSSVSVMDIAPHAEHIGWFEYKYEGGAFITCACGYAVSGDNKEDVIRKHNTRPAPPIGQCKDCARRKTPRCSMYYECQCGAQHTWETSYSFCSEFEPKEKCDADN